jgi:putative membrane protein
MQPAAKKAAVREREESREPFMRSQLEAASRSVNRRTRGHQSGETLRRCHSASGGTRCVMQPVRPFHLALLAAVLAVLAWSGVSPYDRLTWWLEVAPTIVGLIALAITWRRFRLTDLALALIAVHMIILCVGGNYTYARVPIGDWVSDWLQLQRNHYDRLGHFVQGFVPAIVAREIFVRNAVVASNAWRVFFIIATCLAISALYELLEWIAALASGEAASAFLGTQGDVWDTQTDMALALVGAVCAVASLSRWHDRQLRAIPAAAAL